MSFPRALVIVLALAHALGVTELVRRATCDEECERDGCENDCTPGDSPSCVCHCPSAPTAAPPAVVVVTEPASRPSVVVYEWIDDRHGSPDPREILHVPRSRVA